MDEKREVREKGKIDPTFFKLFSSLSISQQRPQEEKWDFGFIRNSIKKDPF